MYNGKVDALAFLHSLDIVHGGVLAENIWIQADGHVVLDGFSCAKFLSSSEQMARKNIPTYCGLREDQAPEIILGWNHDFAIDCWSLGILLCILHFGRVSGVFPWL